MARSGAAGARRRRPPASDVTEDDARLRAQLHEMGLYAADTLGDGNCLFRYVHGSRSALADQLYGDARHHARLRAETCDQLAAHPERYAAFVETEKPFDQYVAAMRTSGTYGGHRELAAFAHRFQKPIRIVQPDLVYVVACDDASRAARAERARRERARQTALDASRAAPQDAPQDAREARRAARRAKRAHARGADDDAGEAPCLESVGPLCIAYVPPTDAATTTGSTTARYGRSTGRTRACRASRCRPMPTSTHRRSTRTRRSCCAACPARRAPRCGACSTSGRTGRRSSRS